MRILEQLEHYRLENHISQQILAQKIGVVFSAINHWLNGKSKPNKIQNLHIEKFLKAVKKK